MIGLEELVVETVLQSDSLVGVFDTDRGVVLPAVGITPVEIVEDDLAVPAVGGIEFRVVQDHLEVQRVLLRIIDLIKFLPLDIEASTLQIVPGVDITAVVVVQVVPERSNHTGWTVGTRDLAVAKAGQSGVPGRNPAVGADGDDVIILAVENKVEGSQINTDGFTQRFIPFIPVRIVDVMCGTGTALPRGQLEPFKLCRSGQ